MNDRIIKDITDYIFVCDTPKRSDIIFLPGGTYAEVPEKGAELFSAGIAPVIMPSGKYSVSTDGFAGVSSKEEIYTGNYGTECEFYSDVLNKCGVPEYAIIGERRARYTMQNAVFSREVCDAAGIRVQRAVICCKSFHARRCLVYYASAFPEAELAVCPADCNGISRENWYKSKEGFDTVMSEVRKTGDQAAEALWVFTQRFMDI